MLPRTSSLSVPGDPGQPPSPPGSHNLGFPPKVPQCPDLTRPRPASSLRLVTRTANLAFSLVRRQKADKHRAHRGASSLLMQSRPRVSEPSVATPHSGAPHPPLEGFLCHRPLCWAPLPCRVGHISHPVLTPSSTGLTRRDWANPRAAHGTGFRAHECPCPKGPANRTRLRHPRLPAVTSIPCCSLLSLRVGFIKLPLPFLEVTGTSCGQGSLPAGCTGTRSAQQQVPGLYRVPTGCCLGPCRDRPSICPSIVPSPSSSQAAPRGGSFTALCCHGNVGKPDPHGLEVVLGRGRCGGQPCVLLLPRKC